MASVNKWIGIGNLGADPEVRFTQSGTAVCNFSVACNEKWKDKDGKPQERVEWVKVVAWGDLAQACGKYLAKGRQCYVEGKLQTKKWTDKAGVDRWTTEVLAANVTFLGDKQDWQPEPPRDDNEPAL